MPMHERLVSVPVAHRTLTSRMVAAVGLLMSVSLCMGQQPSAAQQPQITPSKAQAAGPLLTVPPGTQILLTLLRPVSTRETKPGDTVYLQTTFPVTAADELLIPAGTFLQGTLAGFAKHSHQLDVRMQSATLIFSNGYSVNLSVASDLIPGPDADIQKQPGHPKAAVASDAGVSTGGLAIGGAAAGIKGAVLGGAIAGPAGFVIAEILLHHGSSTEIGAGSPVQITLQHPLLLEKERVAGAVRHPNHIILAGTAPGAASPSGLVSATGTCFTPGIPGTPDTVIPGTPGIPATPGSPGTPGTPPTVIPGTPAIPGTPYPCPQ